MAKRHQRGWLRQSRNGVVSQQLAHNQARTEVLVSTTENRLFSVYEFGASDTVSAHLWGELPKALAECVQFNLGNLVSKHIIRRDGYQDLPATEKLRDVSQ
jgi:hypothetical protein